MLTRYSAFDRPYTSFDQLRRQMFRMLDEIDNAEPPAAEGFPRVNMADTGASIILEADVPGLTEKDVDIQLTSDVLTLKGERKLSAPEGYAVHRNERGSLRFARSFALPCKVDVERSSAAVKDGVLTVTLAKAAEAQPRKISVKAQLTGNQRPQKGNRSWTGTGTQPGAQAATWRNEPVTTPSR